MRRNLLLFLAAGLLITLHAKSPAAYYVYVGTYTGPASEGVYLYRFDTRTGALTKIGLAGKASNPSFLAISPDQKRLYAVSEAGRDGLVTSFSISKDGTLAEINHTSSRGSGPCFVAVDKTGGVVLVANYGSGSVASYRVEPDGRLSDAVSAIQHQGSSVQKGRQEGPHAHSFNVSPDNRFAVAADLGTDELRVYKLDAATATLTPNEPPAAKLTPGDGPRHFAFHPKGKFAYVINELHSTVTLLTWDAKHGVLTPVESVSTLPKDFRGENSTAEILVHPSGKFVYGSNRGHDSIAVFSVDRVSGKLKMVETVPTRGAMPRNFRLEPAGKWLIAANQRGNNMTVFRVDPRTGKLTQVGEPVEQQAPVCVKFVAIP